MIQRKIDEIDTIWIFLCFSHQQGIKINVSHSVELSLSFLSTNKRESCLGLESLRKFKEVREIQNSRTPFFIFNSSKIMLFFIDLLLAKKNSGSIPLSLIFGDIHNVSFFLSISNIHQKEETNDKKKSELFQCLAIFLLILFLN